jgi:uncharacterized membrane protein
MEKFFDCFGKSMRSIIAFLVVILSFTFLFSLTRHEVPKANESIINVAAGLVLAALGVVIGYYFGSSKDKSDRDKADIKSEQL